MGKDGGGGSGGGSGYGYEETRYIYRETKLDRLREEVEQLRDTHFEAFKLNSEALDPQTKVELGAVNALDRVLELIAKHY